MFEPSAIAVQTYIGNHSIILHLHSFYMISPQAALHSIAADSLVTMERFFTLGPWRKQIEQQKSPRVRLPLPVNEGVRVGNFF
jgi:hypothetical protein